MEITAEQRKKAKGQGFISNKDGIHFSARIVTGNGVLTAAQVRNLCEAAEKFGNGQIAFTSRLSVELPGIKYEDFENLKEHIAKADLSVGGTGPKVRPIVPCKGTFCSNGLYDTLGIGTKLHKRFYEGYRQVNLPHKFKIGVGGCQNNCIKPETNDLGIVGQLVPKHEFEKCRGCKNCTVVKVCPMEALKINDDGKITVDKSLCINCGKCIGKCAFGCIPEGEFAFKIFIGGRWGKKIRIGTPLKRLFNEEEALDIVEKAILLFKYEGKQGERFASVIDRLGMEKVEEILVSDDLLNKKEEIIGK